MSEAAAEAQAGMLDTALMPRIQNSDRSMSTSSGLRASDKIQVSMQCLVYGTRPVSEHRLGAVQCLMLVHVDSQD